MVEPTHPKKYATVKMASSSPIFRGENKTHIEDCHHLNTILMLQKIPFPTNHLGICKKIPRTKILEKHGIPTYEYQQMGTKTLPKSSPALSFLESCHWNQGTCIDSRGTLGSPKKKRRRGLGNGFNEELPIPKSTVFFCLKTPENEWMSPKKGLV